MFALLDALESTQHPKRARITTEEDDKDPNEPTLDVFLNHSDCDGTFNQEEAKQLYPLFRRYRAKFKKSKPEDGFLQLYDDFTKAFRMVSKKKHAKIVYT
jgi:hypothetical protein